MRRQRLLEDDEPDQGRHSGLRAQQHAEHALRHPAQDHELEGERQGRGKHGDDKSGRNQLTVHRHAAPGESEGYQSQRAKGRGQRETGSAVEHLAGPGGEHDVRCPADRGAKGEDQAQRI